MHKNSAKKTKYVQKKILTVECGAENKISNTKNSPPENVGA